MFNSIRVQLVHPCRARCAWCSTHKRNPTFQALADNGEAERFHAFYLEVLERFRPKELFVSGGEPLLYPKIESWLQQAASLVGRVHVFTSYQFSRKTMQQIATMRFPANVTLNHTPIYFEPSRWHKLTQGFPFDVYRDNLRDVVPLGVRKRFKFIVNHSQFEQEIARFVEAIKPDDSCEVSLKLMNDQGNGLVVPTLQRTSEHVRERIQNLDAMLTDAGWQIGKRPKTSADAVKDVVLTGDVTLCPYRAEPHELRLAFYRGEEGKWVLKYRYCPFFPPDFGHKFHIGYDDMDKLERNFTKGPFRDHCGRCRLLHYRQTDASASLEADRENPA